MRKFLFILPLLLLSGCENYYTSSIPTRPVYMRLSVLQYPSLVSAGSYAVLDKTGLYENGTWRRQLLETERYGYGGVVLYCTGDNLYPYVAFDLCCPFCADPINHCEPTGLFAECPRCGEVYDLSCYGMSTKGISKEALKRYAVGYMHPYITVSN